MGIRDIKEILEKEANNISKQNDEILQAGTELSPAMHEMYSCNIDMLIKMAEIANKLEIKEEVNRFMPIILVVIFWIFTIFKIF